MTDAIAHQDIARILSEALPFMQRYWGETVVVKYGGHAMGDPDLARKFASDIVQLKLCGINPVVVHGGGPQIGRMLDKLGIVSRFEDGLRVTDAATMEVVEMVLAGSINKGVVSDIQRAGGRAVGISGKDGNLCMAEKLTRTKRDPDSNIERVVDLGFVGEPKSINPALLKTILQSDAIPVIAPIGVSAGGDSYNINADTFAGAIAGALAATRLLFLTDVPGVLDKSGELIDALTVAEAKALIADGTIHGGMIPKVETCFEAIGRGVESVVILNGKTPHAVLLELFTEHGAGTLLRA